MATDISKLYAVEEKNGQVSSITFLGDNGAVELGNGGGVNNALGRSALGAFSDYARFGVYNQPNTAAGLHFFKEPSITPGATIGYINVNYDGPLALPKPDLSEYPYGWAPIVLVGGITLLGRYNLSAKERDDNARAIKENRRSDVISHGKSRHAWNTFLKHTNIDFFLQGVAVTVHVGAFGALADKMLAVYAEKNDKKAAALRESAYVSAIQAKETWQQGQIHNNQVTNGEAEPLVNPANPSIMVRVFNQNRKVDMMSLPRGKYTFRDARGRAMSERTMNWNPQFETKLEAFAGMAPHLQIVLPTENK